MRVTIVCDASFDPNDNIGAFAYYAVSKRKKGGGNGALKVRPLSSIQAEMMAIVRGLVCALNRKIARPGDKILFRVDCIPAYEKLLKRQCQLSKTFIRICDSARLTVEFRHIPAHTNDQDPVTDTHRTCDRLSRQAMRKEVFRQSLSGLGPLYKER